MSTRPGHAETLLAAIQSDPRLSGVEVSGIGERGADRNLIELSRRDHAILVARAEHLTEGLADSYVAGLARRRAALLLVGNASRDLADRLPAQALVACLEDDYGPETLFRTLDGLFHRLELLREEDRHSTWIRRYRSELDQLIEIARALSQERDLDRLLSLILERTRFITGADAGSIYVVEPADPGTKTRGRLRFKTSQNESVAFESSEFAMPLSMGSIAGAAAVTRQPINIPDVQAIETEAPYRYDETFDEKVGYRTRSMIAVPMISAEDEVIGVIQLINKKASPMARLHRAEDFDSYVVPFDEHSEELLVTLASQAGIALENALLYSEIQRIFEGFVRASVQAIEQRDPTTSGHSLRVSVLSCRLAEVVDHTTRGPYSQQRFTPHEVKELEYAALLHDFGKIGVREQILVKAKKLYPHELDAIKARFAYLLKETELEALRQRLTLSELAPPDRASGEDALRAIDLEAERRRGHLSGALTLILQANEPTLMSEGDFSAIEELAKATYRDAFGDLRPILDLDEVKALQVTKGSLHRDEIAEIRGHVTHTIDFLSRIPWGKTMARIPQIAGAHHEKLDGSGYPAGLVDALIPVQSKIMSIADIFDALTARDRPYKKAVPLDRALKILGMEAADGHVDGELVRLFVEAKVFEAAQQPLSY